MTVLPLATRTRRPGGSPNQFASATSNIRTYTATSNIRTYTPPTSLHVLHITREREGVTAGKGTDRHDPAHVCRSLKTYVAFAVNTFDDEIARIPSMKLNTPTSTIAEKAIQPVPRGASS